MKPRLIIPLLSILTVLAAGAWVWHLGDQRLAQTVAIQSPSAQPQIGGPFTLIDQYGKRVSDRDFRGRYMIVFFGYTYCPDICPTTLAVLSAALKQLGPKAGWVSPIFITVDPTRDTEEKLKDYLRVFGPEFIGLSGTDADIAQTAKAYRADYAKVPQQNGDYLMDHSSIIYLMGPDGAFITTYSLDQGIAGIATDLAGRLPLTAPPVQTISAADNSASPANDATALRPLTGPNVYSGATAGKLSPQVLSALPRIYVPNLQSNDVYVIDPNSLKVVDRYRVGFNPQHVVPSWDLKTLWVTGSSEHGHSGSLTPIDPITGRPGKEIVVPDAYNMYFSPDGHSAIVVAESLHRLEFREPHTMALQGILDTPGCLGINHADYSGDFSYAIFTCEFAKGVLAKIDVKNRKVLGYLQLSRSGMPQDVRVAPDGKLFYVADMLSDGVFLIDGPSFKEVGFIPTGLGAHGLYPSRDGTKLYVTNRGSHMNPGAKLGLGNVAVIDFATRKVVKIWPIPGGGSPDMGNVSADGKHLWLSGRFDNVVYDFDTDTGKVQIIPVGREPHGVAVWPQPGSHSYGHTGIMR
jgi:YVTN family beta-propeller protein